MVAGLSRPRWVSALATLTNRAKMSRGLPLQLTDIRVKRPSAIASVQQALVNVATSVA